MNNTLHTPLFQGSDTRSNAEFLLELSRVRSLPLEAQLRFLRNRQNRDRALSVPKDKLSRMLGG